jgi:hypothetical protein
MITAREARDRFGFVNEVVGASLLRFTTLIGFE